MTVFEHTTYLRSDDSNTFKNTYEYDYFNVEGLVLKGMMTEEDATSHQMRQRDLLTELLLLKVDRASMIKKCKVSNDFSRGYKCIQFYMSTGTDNRTNVKHVFYVKF